MAYDDADSDDLVVNGSKMWITNGAEADWICLLAITSEGPSHRNKSLICVPMDTPGVTVARKIDKLGWQINSFPRGRLQLGHFS